MRLRSPPNRENSNGTLSRFSALARSCLKPFQGFCQHPTRKAPVWGSFLFSSFSICKARSGSSSLAKCTAVRTIPSTGARAANSPGLRKTALEKMLERFRASASRREAQALRLLSVATTIRPAGLVTRNNSETALWPFGMNSKAVTETDLSNRPAGKGKSRRSPATRGKGRGRDF